MIWHHEEKYLIIFLNQIIEATIIRKNIIVAQAHGNGIVAGLQDYGTGLSTKLAFIHLTHWTSKSALTPAWMFFLWCHFILEAVADTDDSSVCVPAVGQVIKAWDIGVTSMLKGEICTLLCNPEYTYGTAGNPPKIPPNSSLLFEVRP